MSTHYRFNLTFFAHEVPNKRHVLTKEQEHAVHQWLTTHNDTFRYW